jgi:putative Ca2+/H+ antiporter (TMEM165/GDT1 family)
MNFVPQAAATEFIVIEPQPSGALSMQALFTSATVVALAEMGDKTQLLSLTLAARYRRPVPILLGVLVATIANHGITAWLGDWLSQWLTPTILNWAIVFSFLGMGIWILIPDKESDMNLAMRKHWGVFMVTLITFFVAEIGDKTEVATIALAAHFQVWLPVVAGTTIGMMLANGPAVFFGHRFADRLPTRWVHAIAAVLFLVLGAVALHKALAS